MPKKVQLRGPFSSKQMKRTKKGYEKGGKSLVQVCLCMRQSQVVSFVQAMRTLGDPVQADKQLMRLNESGQEA